MTFEVWPLGGLKSIGMNVMLYRFGEQWVPVDGGILFADPNDFGVEAVIPDIRSLLDRFQFPIWLITHGHEDHIGGIPVLIQQFLSLGREPPRFYIPPFAYELAVEKVREFHSPEVRRYVDCLIRVDEDQALQFDTLTVRYLPVRHSLPKPFALAFEWATGRTPLRVLHTADFKIDPKEYQGISISEQDMRVWSESPDFLMIDSTNADRKGTSASEVELHQGLSKAMSQARARIFVTQFASNVQRMESVIRVAHDLGKKVYLAGRSLQSCFRLATQLSLIEVPVDAVVDLKTLQSLPEEQQVVICSGSQGEIRSVLAQMAFEKHPNFQLRSTDMVIFSSKLIPGNERSVYRLINDLTRLHVDVIMAEDCLERWGLPIHASGHPKQDELKKAYQCLKPKTVIPIHGGLKQLRANAQVARDCGVADDRIHVIENGTRLHFEWTTQDQEWVYKRQEYEEVGQVLRFSRFCAPSKDLFLKERKLGARGGVLSLLLSKNGHYEFSCKGMWPYSLDRSHIERTVQDFVNEKIKWLQKSNGFDANNRQDTQKILEDQLASALKQACGPKPLVICHLVDSK